jgi:excisionase family DNA binding protein
MATKLEVAENVQEQEAFSLSQLLQYQGQQLARIERLLTAQKETLTLGEASTYSGISKSYLYKLTSSGIIPHYKPHNKTIYFDRSELDSWLKRNRVKTVEEIERETSTSVLLRRKGGVGC